MRMTKYMGGTPTIPEESMDDLGGVLTMKICYATLIRDTEAMGEMDPFMMIEYNGHVYKTQIL